MRFKKQKRHRKTVKFYTACFGFREPFKVLCDGTFIHHLIANNLSPHKSVSNTLGADVKLFTSKCVIEELKSLGSSHAESFHAARKEYKLARCEHDGKRSALDCIIEIIGENNPEHFFVATQDIELRKKFQKIAGVPVLFGLRNALFLEQLSSFQREYVKSAEEERLHMTDLEQKMLQRRVKNILNPEEVNTAIVETGAGDEVARDQVLTNKKGDRNRIELKDKVQFKRKRAKGPNPLSCKKKKNPGSSNPKPEKVTWVSTGDLRSIRACIDIYMPFIFGSGKETHTDAHAHPSSVGHSFYIPDDRVGGSAQRDRARKRKRSRKSQTSSGIDATRSQAT